MGQVFVSVLECPMLDRCMAVTRIDCTGRNARKCGFLRNLLSEYCKLKAFGKCGLCKYAGFCNDRRLNHE